MWNKYLATQDKTTIMYINCKSNLKYMCVVDMIKKKRNCMIIDSKQILIEDNIKIPRGINTFSMIINSSTNVNNVKKCMFL